jgi:4-hydroxyphenylpyruvate dioxygenase
MTLANTLESQMSAAPSQQHSNPLGLSGFEFVEFAAPDPALLDQLFRRMGFVHVANHKQAPLVLYRQGDINFVVHQQLSGFSKDFVQRHGPCCTGFALRVNDAEQALQHALTKDASEHPAAAELAIKAPALTGIGGSILYLCDHRNGTVFTSQFQFLDGVDAHPRGFGLSFIDHLTHNVIDGNMAQWADFYARLFNFYEVKYFDIKGQQTGLRSQAMTAPDGCISIPINESSEPKSQINEYIEQYNGEGVQHIALYTDDVYATVEAMHAQDVSFLNTPDTYYQVIDQRIPNHGEDVARKQKNSILIDAELDDSSKQLLQIFTETNIGPIFFEIIQRKGNKGFGEGNFTALFEAIERDQQQRGVL